MIKKRFWLICATLLLTLVLASSWALADSTFVLPKHTFANAGGQLQSSNYTLVATMGQPSVVGSLSSGNFGLQAGFLAGGSGGTAGSGHTVYLPMVVR